MIPRFVAILFSTPLVCHCDRHIHNRLSTFEWIGKYLIFVWQLKEESICFIGGWKEPNTFHFLQLNNHLTWRDTRRRSFHEPVTDQWRYYRWHHLERPRIESFLQIIFHLQDDHLYGLIIEKLRALSENELVELKFLHIVIWILIVHLKYLFRPRFERWFLTI